MGGAHRPGFTEDPMRIEVGPCSSQVCAQIVPTADVTQKDGMRAGLGRGDFVISFD